MPALEKLEAAFLEAQEDAAFQTERNDLLVKYAGRPTPLTRCRNLGSDKARIYLKREDLLHGGAHKTNQVLGQALLARKMGKTRLIAETGAGQHGVATAIVRSEEHTSELQSLMRISYAVFCLKKKRKHE